MSFFKKAEHKAIHFIVKRPKYLILIAGVVFLVLFSALETVRAQLFMLQLDNYRTSARVEALNDSVDRLVAQTEKGGGGPALCELSLDGNIVGYNVAYQTQSNMQTTEDLMRAVHDRAMQALPSPAFYSVLNFLPHIKSKQDTSEAAARALNQEVNLTKQDTQSQYCLRLLSVLSEVYFLKTISTPEGVSAMRVGQVENFQTNVRKAQEALKAIIPPPEFADEHVQLTEILNHIALHLREDENDFVSFSRRIEMQTSELAIVLQSLHDKSAHLRNVPGNLYLESTILREK